MPARPLRRSGYQGKIGDHLVVVENTPERHNMVVCTLCSCYPWDVLGLPPVWYKSFAYRSRAVKEPRAVLARIWPDLARRRGNPRMGFHRRGPLHGAARPPRGTEGWTEEQLAELGDAGFDDRHRRAARPGGVPA